MALAHIVQSLTPPQELWIGCWAPGHSLSCWRIFYFLFPSHSLCMCASLLLKQMIFKTTLV